MINISDKMANTRSKPKRINDIINWDTVDDVDKVCSFSTSFDFFHKNFLSFFIFPLDIKLYSL